MLSFLVQLDPKIQEFVALGLTFVVSFLLLQLANYFPALAEYLGQYKVAIVTWLTGLVVQLVQAQLDKIPASYDSLVTLVMQLVVEVIIVLTTFYFIRQAKVKGYLALQ